MLRWTDIEIEVASMSKNRSQHPEPQVVVEHFTPV
ncbi:hypothetical protein BC739_000498 [Kutzneria viridogrisea]|uniref:Uncharacterized protein n=1 Tax=Kutzneria viridogrisea TaxID=47990 RepID=A0ABR6B975_9PSEU|nr:hypothetical protein [Kutzneria viridogrisea]